VTFFRRESLHQKLARQGGLVESPPGEDRRAPWDKAGIHGVHRPREWDEVATVETDLAGDHASFVVLDDEIVIEEGPDGLSTLADAISLDPPFRAEGVRRSEGVWAVAARRIEVVRLPGLDGRELEQTRHGGGLTLLVDGARRFGSISALERDADYSVRARRLEGELWEVEASLL
jgi:hypothetical protein